jgi:hypothetical protein
VVVDLDRLAALAEKARSTQTWRNAIPVVEAVPELIQRVRRAEDALKALWWAEDFPTLVEGPDGRFHDLEWLRRAAEAEPIQEGRPAR